MITSGTIVVAEDPGFMTRYAVGPVRNDQSIRRIKDLMETRGDTVVGEVPLYTYAEFRRDSEEATR